MYDPASPHDGPDPRIGVVIITRDRRDELLTTLGHLTALPERPQIVVVDNGSTDGTAAAVAREHPDVDVIALEQNLGAVGRNVGVEQLDRPYIAFCDDDTWWEPGSLRRAADVLDAKPTIAIVNGSIVVEPDGRDDPICEELRTSPLPRRAGSPGPHLLSFLAGASMVRRSAFRTVGGFDERLLIGGEEALLGTDLVSAGWDLVYIDDVVVHHAASTIRDAHLRRRQGIRNALWFFWLRRPLRPALRRSLDLVRHAQRDRVTVGAVVDAVRGLPWVIRNRRVVPRDVEDGLQLLDAPQMSSGARSYVS